MIVDLAFRDFQKRYLGSYFGIVWAFANPFATILVFWFVFDFGFKAKPVQDVPYILWLISGIIPWFYFLDSWSIANMAIVDSSYLVSKVVFRVSILPLVKIISTLIVHFFLLFLTIIFLVCYGYYPAWTYLQIFYYLFSMIVLLLGLSWLTSALTVFIRDLGHILSIALQLLFWVTPILWPVNILPNKYKLLLDANPLCYIVQGYRDSFISHQWFWEKPAEGAYFWIVTFLIFFVGAISFSRLRPHFADVL